MNASLKVEREGKTLASVETQACCFAVNRIWFSTYNLLSVGLKPYKISCEEGLADRLSCCFPK